MEEQNKPPATTEGVDYSGSRKPWVTGVLLCAIIGLWSYFTGQIKDKDAEIKRLNEKANARNERDRELEFQLAQSWERLHHESNKAISYTDTTASRRGDFDSPAHAK